MNKAKEWISEIRIENIDKEIEKFKNILEDIYWEHNRNHEILQELCDCEEYKLKTKIIQKILQIFENE